MSGESMELLQGTLDVLVLRALAWGTMHGYAVTRWIRQRTDGAIEIEDAPLYKALHRLERDGAITAEWGLSEKNRRARYYRLTTVGKKQLEREIASYTRVAQAIALILQPT